MCSVCVALSTSLTLLWILLGPSAVRQPLHKWLLVKCPDWICCLSSSISSWSSGNMLPSDASRWAKGSATSGNRHHSCNSACPSGPRFEGLPDTSGGVQTDLCSNFKSAARDSVLHPKILGDLNGCSDDSYWGGWLPPPVTCYACMTHAARNKSGASDEDEGPTKTDQEERPPKPEETKEGVGCEFGT